MSTYEIWIDDPFGKRLTAVQDLSSITAQKIANSPAGVKITLPARYDSFLRRDAIIEVWRRTNVGAGSLFNAYFIQTWQFRHYKKDTTTVWGTDGISLLSRRIVPYPANSAYNAKTANADNMMKAIVRENFGSLATDADRQISSLLSVAPDLGAAPSLTKRFAYRNVLEVLKDLANGSRKAGTLLYFDCKPVIQSSTGITFDFATKTGQPGIDRSSTNQVVFGPSWGNLENADLTIDYQGSANVVYAGGQGLEENRIVEEREDTLLSKATPWARDEVFYNVSGQAETQAAVQAAGDERLAELRPRTTLRGEMVETPASRFGVHWNFGDRVIVAFRDLQFTAIINGIALIREESGAEKVDASFEIL